MSDVVSRLLAAIDERQRKAEAAARLQWDSEEGWGRDGHTLIPHIGVIHEDQPFEHILANDPPSVLRLCQAHRDIVALHKITVTSSESFDPMAERRVTDHDVECEVCGWCSDDPKEACETLLALARGYGVEDGEDHHGA